MFQSFSSLLYLIYFTFIAELDLKQKNLDLDALEIQFEPVW